MPKTHRFAFTISGGLALGAYEAGVLSQLYRDLHAINSVPNGPRIIVDCFSGASAGSITSLIMARALATNDSPDAFERRMWDSWVVKADLSGFLKPGNGPEESAFTQQRVDDIAQTAVPMPVPATGDEGDPTKAIALWMALTNLDGLPGTITYPVRGSGSPVISVIDYSFADYDPYFIIGSDVLRVNTMTEELSSSGVEQKLKYSPNFGWQAAVESAVISSSFPIAFRTKPLTRDLTLYSNYAGRNSDGSVREGWPREITFQAIDGGIFGNEPIGRCIDAVSYLNKLDPSRVEDTRTYLIIEPNPNTEQSAVDSLDEIIKRHQPANGNSAADTNGLNVFATGIKLINAYFDTALYSDFRMVQQVNDQLHAIDQITSLTKEQKVDVLKAVGLDYKTQIFLERIPHDIPTADRLACDFLGDFGGFIKEGFRAFDFYVGRIESRKWLMDWLNRAAKHVLDTEPAEIIKILAANPEPVRYTGQSGPDPGPEGGGAYTDYSTASWCQYMNNKERQAVVNNTFRRVEVILLRMARMNGLLTKIAEFVLNAATWGARRRIARCPPPCAATAAPKPSTQ